MAVSRVTLPVTELVSLSAFIHGSGWWCLVCKGRKHRAKDETDALAAAKRHLVDIHDAVVDVE